MKLLLTGATGILGRRTLEALLADERTEAVHVVSRREITHPDPRVVWHRQDLADPASAALLYARLGDQIDRIVHLAGLYDFRASFAQNYRNNVLPAVHIGELVERLNESRAVSVHFASTYAVAGAQGREVTEAPLAELAPPSMAYSFTKGIAERALQDYQAKGLPIYIYRLGILVGDERDGFAERWDGPYYFLNILRGFLRTPGVHRLGRLPMPGDPMAVMPLVPVDRAAAVFREAALGDAVLASAPGVFGVYNTESTTVEDFCARACRALSVAADGRHLRPWFVRRPKLERRLFSRVGGRAEVLRFAENRAVLRNERFKAVFAEKIPHFSEYDRAFFDGFLRGGGE